MNTPRTAPMTADPREAREAREVWPDTTPMPLEPDSLSPAPIDGLDVNEIQSETVFDRLFGTVPLPWIGPRRR